MKYYSELTEKLYDSEELLRAAEEAKKAEEEEKAAKLAAEKAKVEQEKQARAQLEKDIDDAWMRVAEAREIYDNLCEEYRQKYHSAYVDYHFLNDIAEFFSKF